MFHIHSESKFMALHLAGRALTGSLSPVTPGPLPSSLWLLLGEAAAAHGASAAVAEHTKGSHCQKSLSITHLCQVLQTSMEVPCRALAMVNPLLVVISKS